MPTYKKYTEFGKRVLELANGSQRLIGDILGITQQAVSTRALGKVDWNVGELQKIAQHFGVSMLYFFSNGDGEYDTVLDKLRASSAAHQHLAKLISGVSEDTAKALGPVVETFVNNWK